jgi:hypothetical protein
VQASWEEDKLKAIVVQVAQEECHLFAVRDHCNRIKRRCVPIQQILAKICRFNSGRRQILPPDSNYFSSQENSCLESGTESDCERVRSSHKKPCQVKHPETLVELAPPPPSATAVLSESLSDSEQLNSMPRSHIFAATVHATATPPQRSRATMEMRAAARSSGPPAGQDLYERGHGSHKNPCVSSEVEAIEDAEIPSPQPMCVNSQSLSAGDVNAATALNESQSQRELPNLMAHNGCLSSAGATRSPIHRRLETIFETPTGVSRSTAIRREHRPTEALSRVSPNFSETSLSNL